MAAIKLGRTTLALIIIAMAFNGVGQSNDQCRQSCRAKLGGTGAC